MKSESFVTLILALISLTASIVIALLNHRNNKKIESLKAEIDSKSKKDNEIFKFILSYETETLNQYLVALKELLQSSQEIKDKARQLLNNHFIAKNEKEMKLELLKDDIIKRYSNNIYYLNLSDKEKLGHKLKNQLVDLLNATGSNSVENFNLIFQNVTSTQNDLQKEVHLEINKLLDQIKEKAN